MKQSPDLPTDPILSEWMKPKTFEEWEDYNEKRIPLQQEITQFAVYLIYFAKSDLCYISWHLLDRPSKEIISSLTFIANQLEEDPEAIEALWAIRDDLNGSRPERWNAKHRTLEKLGRLES